MVAIDSVSAIFADAARLAGYSDAEKIAKLVIASTARQSRR